MAWSLAELEEHLLIGSTLVEGSTLTEEEARAVLAGRTVSGHPVTETRELLNYRAAAEWLLRELARSPWVSEDLVLGLHRRLFDGLAGEAGRFKSHENFTVRADGRRHAYLHPSRVDSAMRDWITRFNDEPSGEAAEATADLYARFQQIHPFADGNGRIARLLVAYWLHWRHGLAFRFYASDKLEHLRAIEASDDGDLAPLVGFFRDRVTST